MEHLLTNGYNQKIPEPSKVFISALSRTSVTVSGPPARLKHIFLVSDFFRDHSSVALPVYAGLCHAKHIYNHQHVDSIVQTTSIDILSANLTPNVPVLSTNTGKAFLAKTVSDLFNNIVEEILTQPIHWDNVVHSVLKQAKISAVSECSVLSFRTSLPVHELVEGLGGELKQVNVTTKDLVSWIATPNRGRRGPRSPQQAKLAIVGMACRMPGGADDTDKFWGVLSQGLDVHKKIPADRFDVDSHFDPTGKRVNTSLTPYGCFIDDPGAL